MKYSPITFKNVKMSSFLHFVFYIAIRNVTRLLSKDRNVSKKGPLASVRGPLANNQKKKLEK